MAASVSSSSSSLATAAHSQHCYSPACRNLPAKLCYAPSCKSTHHFRHVKLVRGPSGLGMKIYGSDLREGVRVGEITPRGSADATKAIFPGDLIYSINGKNMSKANHDEVVQALSDQVEIQLVLVPQGNITQAGPAPPSISSFSSPRHSMSLGSREPSTAGLVSPGGPAFPASPFRAPSSTSLSDPRRMSSASASTSAASAATADLPPPYTSAAAPAGAPSPGGSNGYASGGGGGGGGSSSGPAPPSASRGASLSALPVPPYSGLSGSSGSSGSNSNIHASSASTATSPLKNASHSASVPTPTATSASASASSATPSTKGLPEVRKVTLVRSKIGFGMKIRSDPNIRGVRVSDISPTGAAALSGQIFVGDVILEINDTPMLDAAHQDVVAALVEHDHVTLLLQAGEASFPKVQPIQQRHVKLHRQATGLGLKIMAEDKYAKVIEVIPSGAAAVEGSIVVGDRIIEVNGVRTADIPPENLVEAIASRDCAEVVLVVEAASSPPIQAPAKRSKAAMLKSIFSKTPSKQAPPPMPMPMPMPMPIPGTGDSRGNVWTQVAEEWAKELQEQLRQSRANEQQQAVEIAALEQQVSELQAEASAAAALRLELQATKRALDDLKKQSMRTDESQMKEELMSLRIDLADRELGRVQQQGREAEMAAKLQYAEREIARLREARSEIARLNALFAAEQPPTETEA